MKCRICGSELPEKAKFCPGCGHEVEQHLQYSDNMDSNIPEDAYYREIDDEEYAAIKKKAKEEERAKEEAQHKEQEQKRVLEEERKKYETARKKVERERQRIYKGYAAPERKQRVENLNNEVKKEQKNKKDKTGGKQKTQISVIVYLLIILIGGFALYKTGIVDNIVASIGGSSAGQQTNSKITSKKESEIEAENSKKNTEHTEEKKHTSQVLANTDNSNMNAGACLDPTDYTIVAAKDGSFSFGYPNYLFNHSEVNEEGTSYTLSYENGSSKKAELTVYTEENEGNALENARQLYSKYSSSVYKMYFKMQPTRIDSKGMARTLIGGSVDADETEGVYIIAANDGEKNYILKFTYPDPDIDYDYNEIDYVVDCVYRYCSFSGGTYQPRTYQQFRSDNMGTKK